MEDALEVSSGKLVFGRKVALQEEFLSQAKRCFSHTRMKQPSDTPTTTTTTLHDKRERTANLHFEKKPLCIPHLRSLLAVKENQRYKTTQTQSFMDDGISVLFFQSCCIIYISTNNVQKFPFLLLVSSLAAVYMPWQFLQHLTVVLTDVSWVTVSMTLSMVVLAICMSSFRDAYVDLQTMFYLEFITTELLDFLLHSNY